MDFVFDSDTSDSDSESVLSTIDLIDFIDMLSDSETSSDRGVYSARLTLIKGRGWGGGGTKRSKHIFSPSLVEKN